MSNFLKSLSIASAAIGASIVTAGVAQAAPNNTEVLDQLNSYSQEGQTSVAQVNSVFQLRDVSPSDWAFDALRNLVERYNCIVGYPDGTFRGNRPLSRYEFAAGLNACLQQIERLITGGGDVDPADITRLRALVQEFEAELATLGARVDDLEGRVDFLEDHQFSTTTKLNGEVIFGLTDSFGDNDDTEIAFGDRVRLTLETSFTGRDTLITRLAAGNANTFAPEALAGAVGTQTYDTGGNNNVSVDWLAYYFPLRRAQAYVAAFGGLHGDYVSTTFGATGLEDYTGGSGALTHQASSSPIYTIGGGAGAGFNAPLGPVDISLGYLAGGNAASPESKNGLFDGDYAALGQIAFNLGQRSQIGLTYVNSYNRGRDVVNNVTGSPLFGFGSGLGGNPVVGTAGANRANDAVSANTYGVQGKFDFSEKVSIAAYGMLSDADIKGDGLASQDIWSYGLGVGFSDLGKEGNVLGLFAGVPPYVGGNRFGTGNKTPLQIEGFYKYQLNDNISITPGVIWLSNPTEGAGDNDTVIGTVRTTFKF